MVTAKQYPHQTTLHRRIRGLHAGLRGDLLKGIKCCSHCIWLAQDSKYKSYLTLIHLFRILRRLARLSFLTVSIKCRLQTGYKMQTKYKMQTADCRLGIKCRLREKRQKPPLRQIYFEFFNLTYASVIQSPFEIICHENDIIILFSKSVNLEKNNPKS